MLLKILRIFLIFLPIVFILMAGVGFFIIKLNKPVLENNKILIDYSFKNLGDELIDYTPIYLPKKEVIKLLFVGDLMFDRNIRKAAEKNGNQFIFEKVIDLLKNNDLVIANLEGPITTNRSVSLGSAINSRENFIFTFPPELTQTLYENNIKLVNLGNNHILNFGQKGIVSTKKYLDDTGIKYFGEPNGNKSIIKNLEGLKISFINYNQFVSDPLKEQENTINEIKKNKTLADFTIVYAHWGNEYIFSPTPSIKTLAHKFMDAGADLIIGSHSHTIIPAEEYNGKKIYYSLGNFIFDQYFNEDVRKGLAVEVSINLETKQLEFKETKTYLDSNGQTIPHL